MSGYTFHITHAGAETTDHLETLDDLAERVAVEQLAHELNPQDSAGYVVGFAVIADVAGAAITAACPIVAKGHFYVRAAWCLAAPVETAKRSS